MFTLKSDLKKYIHIFSAVGDSEKYQTRASRLTHQGFRKIILFDYSSLLMP